MSMFLSFARVSRRWKCLTCCLCVRTRSGTLCIASAVPGSNMPICRDSCVSRSTVWRSSWPSTMRLWCTGTLASNRSFLRCRPPPHPTRPRSRFSPTPNCRNVRPRRRGERMTIIKRMMVTRVEERVFKSYLEKCLAIYFFGITLWGRERGRDRERVCN